MHLVRRRHWKSRHRREIWDYRCFGKILRAFWQRNGQRSTLRVQQVVQQRLRRCKFSYLCRRYIGNLDRLDVHSWNSLSRWISLHDCPSTLRWTYYLLEFSCYDLGIWWRWIYAVHGQSGHASWSIVQKALWNWCLCCVGLHCMYPLLRAL